MRIEKRCTEKGNELLLHNVLTYPVGELDETLAVLLVRGPVFLLTSSGAVEHILTASTDCLGNVVAHCAVSHRHLRLLHLHRGLAGGHHGLRGLLVRLCDCFTATTNTNASTSTAF